MMQVKIVTLDVRVSENTKRAIRSVGLPIAVLSGSIGLAHAYDTTWIAAGQPVSAASLKANLDSIQTRLAQLEESVVLAGTVVAFAGPLAPTGWLLCDGSARSRTTYAALYAAIGTASGSGDGATTFNLPDYRGRFLRGVDNGAGRDPEAATRAMAASGGNLGDRVGSVQSDMFRSHTHAGTFARTNVNSAWQIPGGSNINFNGTIDPAGGTETRPVNSYVNYIVKY